MTTQVELENKALATEDNLFVLVLVPKLGGFSVPEPLELEICGRSILGWVEQTVATYPYRKVSVSPTDDILSLVRANSTHHKYIMVLYADSPLLRRETIDEALGFAMNFSHKAIRMPRGWLFETDYIMTVDAVQTVTLPKIDGDDFLAIYNYAQLARATAVMRERINIRHMENGVQIIDPTTTYIDDTVTIDAGVVVEPNVVIRGKVSIHEGAVIGPFAHIRTGTKIGKNCRIGNFVEIKNSTVAEGSKISHMTYVGDAQIGQKCNIGCGVVFCNYDGKQKHETTVGDGVFVGSNSNLVAPVTLEDNSFVAAGSTVTKDVPSKALAIGRARQENKENWVQPEVAGIVEIIKDVIEQVEAKQPEPEPEPVEEIEVGVEETTPEPETIFSVEIKKVREVVAVEPQPEPEPEEVDEVGVEEEYPDEEEDEGDTPFDTSKAIPEFDWDNAEVESFYEGRD